MHEKETTQELTYLLIFHALTKRTGCIISLGKVLIDKHVCLTHLHRLLDGSVDR